MRPAYPQYVPRQRIVAHIEELTEYKPFPDLVELAFIAANYFVEAKQRGADMDLVRTHVIHMPQYCSVRMQYAGREQCTVGEVLDSLNMASLF